MAGHSKWANIKRRKGAQDAKRAKIFAKLIKEITIAIKEGGNADPEFNPRLRLAIANAKGQNLPKDNIERAIKRASEAGGADYINLDYEGYGPGGVALYVECKTDNQNRTVSNVRSYFSKNGGSLATSGSVEFLFERKGVFVIDKGEHDVEELTLELIDGGAEEVEEDAESSTITITTDFQDFGNMQKKLEELDIEPKNAELQRIPTTTKKLDLDEAKTALKLIDKLEDDDDVSNVFHNMELTEEIAAELENE